MPGTSTELERKHYGNESQLLPQLEVGTDAQPRQSPKSPQGRRDPVERHEATRREEMKDAK